MSHAAAHVGGAWLADLLQPPQRSTGQALECGESVMIVGLSGRGRSPPMGCLCRPAVWGNVEACAPAGFLSRRSDRLVVCRPVRALEKKSAAAARACTCSFRFGRCSAPWLALPFRCSAWAARALQRLPPSCCGARMSGSGSGACNVVVQRGRAFGTCQERCLRTPACACTLSSFGNERSPFLHAVPDFSVPSHTIIKIRASEGGKT